MVVLFVLEEPWCTCETDTSMCQYSGHWVVQLLTRFVQCLLCLSCSYFLRKFVSMITECFNDLYRVRKAGFHVLDIY